MKIKNLAEMKKKMVKGCEYVVLEHFYHPEYSGSHRRVNVVQTNGVYSVDPTDPTCIQSIANMGKGIWMEFRKASNWEFDEDMKCTKYNEFKTWENGIQVTRREKVFTLQFV